MTLFTQGAAGSRHTSWPVFLSVALCKSKRQRCLQNMHHWIVPNKVVPSLKGQISVRTRGGKKKVLTWSRSPDSASWRGSAPPFRCGGRWVCSPSGCSGSAAQLPNFLESFLRGNGGGCFSERARMLVCDRSACSDNSKYAIPKLRDATTK